MAHERRATVQRIQTATPSPAITAATLQPFDPVILDQLTRDDSAAEAAILRNRPFDRMPAAHQP